MNSIWQALAWKEWHEHKWKLAALTAIVVGVSSMPFFDYDPMSFGAASTLVVFCIAPLAMFIGAGVATSEGSRGTLKFTRALPVPIWKIAAHKLVAGALTCVVPIVTTFLLMLAVYVLVTYVQANSSIPLQLPLTGKFKNVDVLTWMIHSIGGAALMALSVYMWTAAVGARSKDEVSACAWSLLGIVVWWAALFNGIIFGELRADEGPQVPLLFAASPGGWIAYASMAVHENASLRPGIVVAVCMQILAMIAYLNRFASGANSPLSSRNPATVDRRQSSWLAPPFASHWSATIWKQYRESRPIALAGLAGVGLTSMLVATTEWRQIDFQKAGFIVSGVSAYFGLLVTLVLAVGLFLNDLQPQLHTFWRSRPVAPNQYFWLKFITALVVLAAAFAIPFLFSAVTAGTNDYDLGEILPWAILVPIWLYCAAAMMTCLVRHAIYAAILSGGAMYLSFLLVVGAARGWMIASNRVPWEKWNEPTSGEVAASMVIGSIAFTVIAWLCVRNDWGWKGRY